MQRLGTISGCQEYQLFLCNSGAEANENALKLASFHTGKSKVIAFKNAFHGRTSAAVATTDNPKINAPINKQQEVTFLALNDFDTLEKELKSEGTTARLSWKPYRASGDWTSPARNFISSLPKNVRNTV